MTDHDARVLRNDHPALILASASPRRFELLAGLGVAFRVVAADIDETPLPNEAPLALASRLARAKSAAVAESNPASHVLGSDTVVAVGDEALGKPIDADDAAAMLRRLSARRHVVHSALALIRPGGELALASNSTAIEFAPLPEDWIEAYVASGEPMDKAGSYAIQGAASVWVRRIEGSYSAVVGLPLFETAEILRAAGFAASGVAASGSRVGSAP